jgi:hypothetical protein
MERGPMALFGAIVAVGLGPAMWLGAQFGNAIDVPTSPPAVTSEHGPQHKTQENGGVAGSAPDGSVLVETTPRSEIQPLPGPTKRPAAHKTSKPAHSADPSPSSASPSTGDDDHSSPPSGSDQSASPDPSGGSTSPAPSPPADQNPGGTNLGSGGSGGTADGQPIAS